MQLDLFAPEPRARESAPLAPGSPVIATTPRYGVRPGVIVRLWGFGFEVLIDKDGECHSMSVPPSKLAPGGCPDVARRLLTDRHAWLERIANDGRKSTYWATEAARLKSLLEGM